MPIYEYRCNRCGLSFEVFHKIEDPTPLCVRCGDRNVSRLISQVTFRINSDQAFGSVKKRVSQYLKDGKYADAIRFVDKAAPILKSDSVKRMQEQVHRRAGSRDRRIRKKRKVGR